MSTPPPADNDSNPTAQPITRPLTRAAIFIVATLSSDANACTAVRGLCADLRALLRAVGFRDLNGGLSCIVGFGAAVWERLFGRPQPAELHPFREIRAGTRHAVSTPGDLLFHIRAERMDLCFELARLITTQLGAAVTVVDEVHGFQYFENRDLLGFVDGTENPTDREALEAVLIGPEDATFSGGSYVIVQKYLHDMGGWNALSAEAQERIIGRTKLDNVELDSEHSPSSAHKALTTIVENGVEMKIVRANMPFGELGQGEFGTYFIGYCRTPRIIEQMLENMFIGRPPGNYDRLLDFSRAVTGSLFFIPAASFLDAVDAGAEPTGAVASSAPIAGAGLQSDGSLGIGSLKGLPQNEQSSS